jgi:hypothetical protein
MKTFLLDAGFIGSRELAQLLDIHPRTLAVRVKAGEIPPPDRPAKKLGAGHKWRVATVRFLLEAGATAAARHGARRRA